MTLYWSQLAKPLHVINVVRHCLKLDLIVPKDYIDVDKQRQGRSVSGKTVVTNGGKNGVFPSANNHGTAGCKVRTRKGVDFLELPL